MRFGNIIRASMNIESEFGMNDVWVHRTQAECIPVAWSHLTCPATARAHDEVVPNPRPSKTNTHQVRRDLRDWCTVGRLSITDCRKGLGMEGVERALVRFCPAAPHPHIVAVIVDTGAADRAARARFGCMIATAF